MVLLDYSTGPPTKKNTYHFVVHVCSWVQLCIFCFCCYYGGCCCCCCLLLLSVSAVSASTTTARHFFFFTLFRSLTSMYNTSMPRVCCCCCFCWRCDERKHRRLDYWQISRPRLINTTYLYHDGGFGLESERASFVPGSQEACLMLRIFTRFSS